MNRVWTSLALLGLCGKPALPTIREQYLRLAKKFHPDVQGGSSEKMKQINAAYELIQLNAHLFVTKSFMTNQKGENNPSAKPSRPKNPHTHLSVDLNISDEDKAHPRSHPFSYCIPFTVHDDLNLYRSIQIGNTARQVARSFGLTEKEVRDRVNHPQFKRRIRMTLSQSNRQAGTRI